MIRTANITGPISRKAGGLFESVRRLVQSLGDLGMDVRVFGAEDEFCVDDIATWNPVRVSAFKVVGPKQFGCAFGMLSELEAFGPDIIHTHGIWLYSSVLTTRYARASGNAYMISPHGMLDAWAVRNSVWKKRVALALYERRHLEGAACLRALCGSEAQAFRAFGLKNPICIIPNGIDIPESIGSRADATRQTPEDGEHTTGDGGLAYGKKVLLYLGRIHPKKGLVNLLRAWSQVARPQSSGFCPQSSAWVLAIAGWDQGGHETELKALARELDLSFIDTKSEITGPRSRKSRPPAKPTSVVFLGPQFGARKAACYANCDAFILPSFSEGLPMVVLEAWACGKPVLMTPECNLSEAFTLGAALRIETSVDSTAQGLRDLFTLPDSLREEIGAKGLALVQRQFLWPEIAQQMKHVYEWLLGGGPRPACVQTI